MTLPIFLELAISLIFIYLILSLLASEFQELIATILQWRAAHLKQSIEILLGGTPAPDKNQAVKNFADQLYQHEFIKTLNHEAQGVTRSFRWLIHLLGRVYRWITHTPNTFNQDEHQWSGPSYLPPDAFASSLLQILKVGDIGLILTLDKFANFNENQIDQIRSKIQSSVTLSSDIQQNLMERLQDYEEDLAKILKNLSCKKTTLSVALAEIEIHYLDFIQNVNFYLQQTDAKADNFRTWLEVSAQVFDGSKKTLLINTLKPNLLEVVQSLEKDSDFFKNLNKIIEKYNIQESEFNQENFYQPLENLPIPLKNSLKKLAEKVQSDTGNLNLELEQLQREIEIWFSQSMERAAGVYKRNAKGFGILIGLAIAWGSNADSFNIVSSLYHSSDARSILLKNAAETVNSTVNTDANTTNLRDTINPEIQKSLDNLLLPIGWHSANEKRQTQKWWTIAALNWKIPYPNVTQFCGWVISAIAISMGSAFWFDLLKKVVEVRNTGQPLSRTGNHKESDSKL